MDKVYPNAAAALQGVLHDGMAVAAGGFRLCGIPEPLNREIENSGVSDLTFVSNDGGADDFGIKPMLAARRCRKPVASFIGGNRNGPYDASRAGLRTIGSSGLRDQFALVQPCRTTYSTLPGL